MRYILSTAIGPVQDFIAAARRTRDLWCGSWLLSEVSKAAAKHLADLHADLIFPSVGKPADLDPHSGFTVVNKLLAIVDSANIAAVAEGVRKAAYDRFFAEAETARRESSKYVSLDSPLFASQTKEFLEVYSAWAPYQESEHRQARSRVELLAAARKALRNFPAYTGTHEMKSSLDGAREDVIRERKVTLRPSNVRENERLDAIGIVKRFSGKSPPFESTIDVAGLPFRQRSSRAHPAKFKEYEDFLRDQHEQKTLGFLYEHESRQILRDDPEFKARILQFRELFGAPKPPYYGMLIGDGDSMGKTIEQVNDKGRHQDFSRRLSLFASQAREAVTRHEGCPVYTGGDDVMALLPLHTALACLGEINKNFRQAVDGFADQPPTFSAGFAVAHALEPLSEVREIAHRAERKAKREEERNALAMIVTPRSGADVYAGGKWDTFLPLVERIVHLYRSKQLSAGLAYELRDLLAERPSKVLPSATLRAMVLSIAGKKESSVAALALIPQEGGSRAEIERLCQALLVARPFARAQAEAAGE